MATGMVDIARQTVEFLYEENGGIPRDLYLPTIEDIKDEANKFTIDKVRKGSITCTLLLLILGIKLSSSLLLLLLMLCRIILFYLLFCILK